MVILVLKVYIVTHQKHPKPTTDEKKCCKILTKRVFLTLCKQKRKLQVLLLIFSNCFVRDNDQANQWYNIPKYHSIFQSAAPENLRMNFS